MEQGHGAATGRRNRRPQAQEAAAERVYSWSRKVAGPFRAAGMGNMKTRKVNRKPGFTLIELLVVIAIIGVLFAVAMPIFENAGRKDPARAAQQVIGTLRLARQHAINKRQWVVVVFPTRDGGAFTGKDADKCLRSYAVLAATNNLDGTYQFDSNLRDPRSQDMQFTFISDWKTLPDGIYFDEDRNLSGNYVFGALNGTAATYTGAFDFPLDPANPHILTRPMGAVLFKPNGRAYVLHDSNANGKYWQDTDKSKIYVTSAKYFENPGGVLSAGTAIPGTSTVVQVRNKTGQVQIWDGSD